MATATETATGKTNSAYRSKEYDSQAQNVLAKSIPYFLLINTILASLFLLFYWWSSNRQLSEVKSQEVRLVEFQEQKLVDRIRVSLEDLQFLGSYSNSLETISSNFENIDEITDDFSLFSREKGVYDQIRILDTTGQERIRVNNVNGEAKVVSEEKLQNKGNRYYFYETFNVEQGEYYVSPLDLNMERGEIEQPLKPMIRIGMPLFTEAGEKFGIILLNYKAQEVLESLRNLSKQAMGTGMLLNSEGYWLVGPQSDFEWGFMYEDRKQRSFASAHETEWQTIISDRRGQIINENGIFTFATVRPFEKTSNTELTNDQEYFWVIVSHVSQKTIAQLLLPLKKNLFFTFAVLCISIFFLSIIRTRLKLLEESSRTAIEQKNVELEETVSELEEALTEIKTLQGILPICSYCKEIRNDKGAWIRMENYIQAHSSAEFSHSICEKCLDKHFPEVEGDSDD